MLPDWREISKILYTIINSYHLTYIVIDGLDECGKETQDDILSVLNRLLKLDSVVKIFVSAREEPRILTALKDYSHLRMLEAHVADDITVFVKETVESRLQAGDLPVANRNPLLKQEIISELVAKAHGMYVSFNNI